MKTLGILVSTLTILTAQAAPVEMSRILKDTTTTVALDLNDKTVFCTDRGYGNIQLKVSVPDLDWLAHFDHRVPGEGLPCMTAGRCSDRLGPKDILTNDRIGLSRVRVVLTQRIVIDSAAGTCHSELDESVTGNIRGHAFSHGRSGDSRDVDYEICAALIKAPRFSGALRR